MAGMGIISARELQGITQALDISATATIAGWHTAHPPVMAAFAARQAFRTTRTASITARRDRLPRKWRIRITRLAARATSWLIIRRASGDRLRAADDERDVLAAEAEAVAERVIATGLASDVGNVIQVALRIGVLVIDRRR